jgi:hypothetical protein
VKSECGHIQAVATDNFRDTRLGNGTVCVRSKSIVGGGQCFQRDDILFKQIYGSLLNQLAEMPVFLQRTVASLPSEMLQRPPVEDQFPLIEHLWHVRDCDPDLYALRIRKVLEEERPALAPVDVGAWYVDRRYRERSGQQAISEFAKLRTDLINELKTLEEPHRAVGGARPRSSLADRIDPWPVRAGG